MDRWADRQKITIMKTRAAKETALFCLGLIIPLDYRLGNHVSGLISVSTAELVIVSIFSTWMLMVLKTNRALSSVNFKRVFVYFAYAIWTFLVSLFLLDKEMLQIWRDIFVALLMLLMIVSWVESERATRRLVSGFLAGMLVNGVLGVLQIAFGGPRPFGLDMHGGDYKEDYFGNAVSWDVATGIFPHPNGFALFLAVAIVLSVGRLVFGSQSRGNFWVLFLLATFSLNLYYTYGKGAIMWCLVGIASLFSSRFLLSRFHFLYAGLAVVGVIASIIYYALPNLLDHGGGGTILTRVILWGVATDVSIATWSGFLIGGNHHAVLSASLLYSSFEYANAHNAYLNQLVYFGTIGFVLFLIFVVRALYISSLVLSAASGLYSGHAIWAALIVVTGSIFFEPFHQGVGNLSLIMMLCGISYSHWFHELRRSVVQR